MPGLLLGLAQSQSYLDLQLNPKADSEQILARIPCRASGVMGIGGKPCL